MPKRWDSVASLRKHQIESGIDITFNKIFLPYYVNLIESAKPKKVLEIGCGTGHLAENIISLCEELDCLEPSIGMYQTALELTSTTNIKIHNISLEEYCTNSKYDLIMSHMCLQAVPNINVFFSKVSVLLRKNANFIFSIPHPCFWNEYKKFFSEKEYSYSVENFKEVSFTITKDGNNPITGIPYYHRPLSKYFDAIKASNLFVDGFEEVFPPLETQALYGNLWKNPRYCIFHLKGKLNN